jgi:hypothetical protein
MQEFSLCHTLPNLSDFPLQSPQYHHEHTTLSFPMIATPALLGEANL